MTAPFRAEWELPLRESSIKADVRDISGRSYWHESLAMVLREKTSSLEVHKRSFLDLGSGYTVLKFANNMMISIHYCDTNKHLVLVSIVKQAYMIK